MSILVDSHAHVHPCFDLAETLSFAAMSFRAAASEKRLGRSYQAVLCLAETSATACFAAMRLRCDAASDSPNALGSWTLALTQEAESLRASNEADGELSIVAGSQIVSREGLEVLALGTSERFMDGSPIEEVVSAVKAAGALIVLPYGFGKWIGRRGAIIERLINNENSLFLGDNANRLRLLGDPRQLRTFGRGERPILLGSDPLPIPGEERRIGSHGFILQGRLDDRRPMQDLIQRIHAHTGSLETFGRGETAVRFVRNQVRMQISNRLG